MKYLLAAFILISHTLFSQDQKRVSIPVKGVMAMGFSPDNQYFAIAKGNIAQLYNAGNDTKIKELNGAPVGKETHTRDILDLAFNKNGSYMVTGSADKKVKLWKVPEGEVVATFSEHIHPVVRTRFAGERYILGLTEDGTVNAWDRESGTLLYSKSDFQKNVRALEVSNNGQYFAIGGGDKFILVYETATGNVVKKLEGHQNWVRALAFSPDGKVLASGGDDKLIYLWDVDTGAKIKEVIQKGWVYDLEFSQDGKYLAAGLEKTAIHFYNITTGMLSLKLEDIKSPVLKIAISPNGQQVASVEEFGTDIKLWNISSLNIVPVINFKDTNDKSAPSILVSNPANINDNKVVVYQDNIDLRGTITDESGVRSLRVNGIDTPIRQNGNFFIYTPLAIGDNFITIEVTDVNDNIALKKFTVIRKNMEGGTYSGIKAKNYLFVVGINGYTHWPKLNNAVKDATDLVTVLMSNYTFDFTNVTLIKDEQATRSNIYNGLRGLIEKIGPQDNLVVYFSGHGHFDQLLNEGYWIPVEANPNSTGEYVSNSDILKIVSSINSQHTFLIADACFSGALFTDSRRGYTDNVEKFRSRWGLASGRLETVSDGSIGSNSPFATRLIQFLSENEKEKFAISELIQYVKTQVAEDTNQTPIGNPLKAMGDEGGEMVMYKRKN